MLLPQKALGLKLRDQVLMDVCACLDVVDSVPQLVCADVAHAGTVDGLLDPSLQ